MSMTHCETKRYLRRDLESDNLVLMFEVDNK